MSLDNTKRKPETALLLSIRSEHAARIFERSKRYELRKTIPNIPFARVYLYETGGGGVVGCFDVGGIIHESPPKLWKKVGTAATTEERFWSYFCDAKDGYAIKIENPLKFKDAITAKHLGGDFARLVPPQSFLVLEPGQPLHTVLQAERLDTLRAAPPKVSLSPIKASQHDLFKDLVFRHISPHYADIDASFAARTLDVHAKGFDPAGFFTTKKEVLSIYNAANRCIGFTTLTYKSGGCLKTGPTVLIRQYRGKGFGLATRKAIEEHAISQRVRKIYATCPETSESTIRYLLASGMRIEAHLERHYAATHNEFVFGKLLAADEAGALFASPPSRRKGILAEAGDFPRSQLITDFVRMFEATWAPVTRGVAAAIISQSTRKQLDFSAKPKRLICLRSDAECIAAIALLPKRGGAVKGVLLRNTTDADSLIELFNAAIKISSQLEGRKLYFLHPILDWSVVPILRFLGFRAEGLIRAPYRPGQDVVVMSRFF